MVNKLQVDAPRVKSTTQVLDMAAAGTGRPGYYGKLQPAPLARAMKLRREPTEDEEVGESVLTPRAKAFLRTARGRQFVGKARPMRGKGGRRLTPQQAFVKQVAAEWRGRGGERGTGMKYFDYLARARKGK